MFSKDYESGDVSALVEKVAPGTEGSITITVTGTPEVRTKVTFEVNDDYEKVYFDSYEPIVWSINGTKCGTNGTMEEMVSSFEGLTNTYEVGVSLATNNTITVSWSWAFSTGTANDILDTKLADAATLSKTDWEKKYGVTQPSFSADVSATFTVTATQVGD